VTAALDGDLAPLLRLRRRAFKIDAEPPPPLLLSSGVYAATSCEEVRMPWARTTPPDPAERHRQAAADAATIPDSAFEPFDRATALASDTLDLCESWPHAPMAPAFGSGPMPDVPVLLVEGEDDLRTPVENAERTAQLFPQSRLVVVPETGHSAIGSDFSGCGVTAFAHFMQRRPVQSCRGGRRDFQPQPPPPARLADVRRLRGTSGLRGRTLAAVRLTLDDVWEDSITELVFNPRGPEIVRGGGLRAGHYRLDPGAALDLHGVAFVPGVTLTGRIEGFSVGRQRGRVRIGGSAAPHGVLTIRRQRVTGRLGGRRVSAKLNAPLVFAALSSRRAHWTLPPGTP
jgi:hypothetical protein